MAKKTQTTIISAFVELLEKRSIDKITVLDVCEAAGVSRSTFYYHYHDLQDLLESLARAQAELIVRSHADSDHWSLAVMQASMLMQKNRKVVLHIYEGLRHEQLETCLFETISIVVSHFVQAKAAGCPNASTQDIEYVTRILSATFVGLTLDWLRHGIDSAVEEYLAGAKYVLDGFVETAFKKLAA